MPDEVIRWLEQLGRKYKESKRLINTKEKGDVLRDQGGNESDGDLIYNELKSADTMRTADITGLEFNHDANISVW